MSGEDSRGRLAAFCAAGVVLWLAVGFSLGWYYTFTYYGRTGVPMPFPEPCAALVLYYFSVINAATEIQAVHWMLVFPLAGAIWTEALCRTAAVMGHDRPPFPRFFLRLSLAALPVALPGPAMAWLAGQADGGFVWQRMIDIALRRGNTGPWWWLTPLFLTLGALALALQLAQYRRSFPMPMARALRHYPLSAIVLVLASAVIGTLASFPLRWWLE
jgi:hypothetical protein